MELNRRDLLTQAGLFAATAKMAPASASHYELGTMANCVTAGLSVSLQNIHKLGVENVRAHVKPLTDRLQKEMSPLG